MGLAPSPSADIPSSSPDELRTLAITASTEAREDLDADRIAKILRSGSSEGIDAQREAAYQRKKSQVEGMIARHRECLTDVRTTLLPSALNFGDSNRAYLEQLIEQLEANPVDGDKSPFLIRISNKNDHPTFRVNAKMANDTHDRLVQLDKMPGLSPDEHKLLRILDGLVCDWKAVDPLSMQIQAGIEQVNNSPHMKFADKLTKSGILVIGAAAGALGLGISIMKLINGKKGDRMPSMLLLGPLIAWALLNVDKLGKTVDENVAGQVTAMNRGEALAMLRKYRITGNGWRGAMENILTNPNSKIIKDHLADPANLAKREELLNELVGSGDPEVREGLARMIACGDFAILHRNLSRVTKQEAKDLILDYVALGGWRSPADYAALERELTPSVA